MSPDWGAVSTETATQLQRLIRFKTVNPPGDELPLAVYLRDTLQEGGVETTLIETTANRAAVLGVLHGAGARPPVMLVAHTDVVDVEADQWSADPFGGEIRDGYLYGRGAIDDKGMLAVNLVTMLLLARERRATKERFARDVIFLATPDEEAGGEWGMGWLATYHPELLYAEYALNEGGRIRVGEDGKRTLLIQTAEKVSHVVTCTARGTAGHAGVPRADNAILRIGRALAKISNYASDPRHGVSPTILRAGSKFNVIPSEASVLCNIRTRPGDSVDDVVLELVRLIDDPEVAVQIVERGEAAPTSPEHSELYDALATWARTLDASMTVEPYLSNGITDSAKLRRLGVKAYGLLPFPLRVEDETRMHGHDERVPLDSLYFGTRLVFEAVRQVASGGPVSHSPGGPPSRRGAGEEGQH